LGLHGKVLVAEGLQGWHLGGEVIRKASALSHSVFLTIYANVRFKKSLYKTQIHCLGFCMLYAPTSGHREITTSGIEQ